LGEKKGSVRPRGGPAVNVDYTFSEAPTLDLLVIPGGGGTRTLVKDQDFLSSLKKLAGSAPRVATICTGSALLAKTGLLDGVKATSNKQASQWVSAQDEKARKTAQALEYVWDEDSTHDSFAAASAARNDPTTRSPLHGVVLAVRPAKKALLVEHDAVSGIMESMTMAFVVDDQYLTKLKPGEVINAKLYQEKGGNGDLRI